MSRNLRLGALTALLVLGLIGAAGAGSVKRVTGGGQYLTDGEGADDTLAFQVQETSGGQDYGEVEFDPTNSQDGGVISTGRWHGRVVCAEIDVEQGRARFAGFKDARSSQGESNGFEIVVKDNPPSGGDDDLIAVTHNDDGQCNGTTNANTEFFRGEIQITSNG